MRDRTYLDWNATAPLRPQAREAMLRAVDAVGNPSSVHAEGRTVRALIEHAREEVAALAMAEPRNVVFTSGGTEANALALTPNIGTANKICERLLISAIEHPSVLAGGRFPSQAVERLAVTPNGLIDLDALEHRLAAWRAPALVSLMLANNETGIIQPVREAARLVHEAGGLLHVDAVQAAGRIPIDINELEADFLTLSGHKVGGPKGVGALIRRAGAPPVSDPLIKGGGQERGARGGTENVPGIVAFGAAAAAAREGLASDPAGMAALRDRLEAGLRTASPAIVIFGAHQQRLPNTTLSAVPGMKAETALIAFDLEGFALSSGAACSSGKVQPSHVLAAMGVPPQLARAALRISLGPTTTEAQIDGFVRAWIKVSAVLLKETRGIAA